MVKKQMSTLTESRVDRQLTEQALADWAERNGKTIEETRLQEALMVAVPLDEYMIAKNMSRSVDQGGFREPDPHMSMNDIGWKGEPQYVAHYDGQQQQPAYSYRGRRPAPVGTYSVICNICSYYNARLHMICTNTPQSEIEDSVDAHHESYHYSLKSPKFRQGEPWDYYVVHEDENEETAKEARVWRPLGWDYPKAGAT